MDQSTLEKSDLLLRKSPDKGVPGKRKDKKAPLSPSSKPVKQRKPRSPKTKSAKPARPLSAYNVFFKEERGKWLAESEGKDEDADEKAKNKFTQLGYEMGQRWKKLSAAEKSKYEKLAKEDVKRYQKEMEKWEQTEASPKRAKTPKSPHKADKDGKEKAGEIVKAVPSAANSIDSARLISNGQSPAAAARMGTMDPQELMIQQLLASQQGASLGLPMNSAQIPLAGQLSEREAILRQLQLQELASRQTPHLSQLLGGGGSSHLLGSSGYPGSAQYLQTLSGGGGVYPSQQLSGIEQQLLIQRLRENELRSQMASLERGLAAQQYPFHPGQSPMLNLDLLAMQASPSQPGNLPQGSFPASDSEVLANMSVREKLQLLMQLNQQGY